ncbi:cuticle protein 21-like [Zerene cesonia]|uniref:cuticle protein 21-like n=1 Tax=Zerene cesonia TaxID=33412 RepID=UPI0018E56B9A|nr:cuticle protein 21-like [Zerene cesonia]
MISKVISFCAILTSSYAGVIQRARYPELSPLNTFYPDIPLTFFPNYISSLAPYQSSSLAYPSQNVYSNILPQQVYQYTSPNYPHVVGAPLQYSSALDEIVSLNEEPIVYIEPVIHAPYQHVIPDAIVEAQPEYEEKPNYLFAYSVVDSHTRDNKQHQERRDGDVVRGEYSLLEADGTVRRVEYTADPLKGFNAIVSRSKPKEQIDAEESKQGGTEPNKA